MIKIDQDKCIGCGLCANLCSGVFKMNDQGKSVVIAQKDKICAQQAMTACPVKAIIVE